MELVSVINKEVNKSWCVIENFNEITTQYEKYEGIMRLKKQMEEI